MEGSILLESGERVIVAVPQGELCVFNKPRLEFIRPKWTEDSGASQCLYCKSKFTQIRRKHHCRSCGRLFCSKCCNDKMVLTHLGMTDLERICAICKPVLPLMSKALTADTKLKSEAAAGFLELIQTRKCMQELIEMGGLHTLVWLCGTNSSQVHRYAVPALHILSTQVSLQKYLLDAGAVQALSNIMQSFESSEKVISDCISTLLVLSNKEGAHQVVSGGGLSSLLMIIHRVDELTRLLALETIMRTCGIPQVHSQIMSNTQTVKYIISLVTLSQDAQVSTLVFKILAEISATQTPAYTTALSEVEATSSYISKSLKKENSNELLTNVTCLVANLAFAPDTQSHLAQVISQLHSLVGDPKAPYYQHVIRALSNFSQHSQNTHHLINIIPKVLAGLELVTDKMIENHSLSMLIHLLIQSPEQTSQLIIRNKGELFLTKLARASSVSSLLIKAFSDVTVTVCRP